MNTQVSEKSIEETVCGIIAESLAIEIAAVAPDASLIENLGAESLDFLDIVFKIERVYGIQITRGELERAARGDMSEEEFAPNGVISDAGLARLRELMPEASERIRPGLRPAHILGLFTVRTFVHLVMGKLQQAAGQPG
jgi:acyl carrier protein